MLFPASFEPRKTVLKTSPDAPCEAVPKTGIYRGKAVNGAPERIRTSDPQIRSLMLYPAELRARLRASRRLCVWPDEGDIAARFRLGNRKIASRQDELPLWISSRVAFAIRLAPTT